jgi:hypothetical protein
VVIDTALPVATLAVTGSGSASPSFTITGTDANPISGYALVIGTTAPDLNDDLAWYNDSASANAAFNMNSGTSTITGFVKDAAGNISAVSPSNSKSVTKS